MNKNITFLSFLCCVLFCIPIWAQPQCGFDVVHERLLKNDPSFVQRLEAFEKIAREKQELMRNTAARVVVTGTDTAYEIPVVFHVIHTGTPVGTQFNPTDTKLQNVITYLNQAYAATYSGYPAVGSGGVNIPIRFVLAKRDPSCAATTGITRTNGVTALGGTDGTNYSNNGVRVQTANGISDTLLKNIIQWDPTNYYNIWVVNKMDGWSGYVAGGGVVGYAQFAGGPRSMDGTVIMEAFNDVGQTTLPHELGHAFNLYHTFQGGCNTGDCTTTGDLVCDTDPHAQVSGCPTGNNPCTGNPWAPVVNNIMNYTTCTDRFTAGQVVRAKAALFGQRGSLIQSLGGTDILTPPVVYATPVALVSCTNPGIANSSNTNDMGPSTISIGNLTSYSGGYNGDGNQVYIDHTVSTCLQAAVAPATMQQGQTYAVSVGTGFNPENVRVWIDFNNNGSFQAGEQVFSSNGTATDQYRIHTGNTIAIPSTGVVTGVPLRMRVISDFYGNSNPAACGGNLQYGQAEDFTVTISAPLPVELVALKAIANDADKTVLVHWEAASESGGLDYYEIERSVDGGKTFESLGREFPKGANSKYNFTDRSPVSDNWNLYRLNLTGREGKDNYSQVVSAMLKTTTQAFHLYPNPAGNTLNLVVPQAGNYSIAIVNAMGQVIYKTAPHTYQPEHAEMIDLGGLAMAPGVYYFRLTNDTGYAYTSTFVKK